MRILMIGSGLPRLPSGGLAGEGLARGLLALDCEVVLLLPGSRSQGSEAVESTGRLRLIPVNASLVRYGRASGPFGEDRGDAVSRLAAVARVVARQERFDVIHAHDWMAFPAGLAALSESGRPLVAHVHASDVSPGGVLTGDPLVREIEHAALRRADRVLCGSRLAADFVRRYGADPERIRILDDAVDASGTHWRLRASRCLETYREVA